MSTVFRCVFRISEELPRIISYLNLNGGLRAHWWSDGGWSGCLYPTDSGYSSGYEHNCISAPAATAEQAQWSIIYDRINMDTGRLGALFNGTSVKPSSISVRLFLKYQ